MYLCITFTIVFKNILFLSFCIRSILRNVFGILYILNFILELGGEKKIAFKKTSLMFGGRFLIHHLFYQSRVCRHGSVESYEVSPYGFIGTVGGK